MRHISGQQKGRFHDLLNVETAFFASVVVIAAGRIPRKALKDPMPGVRQLFFNEREGVHHIGETSPDAFGALD